MSGKVTLHSGGKRFSDISLGETTHSGTGGVALVDDFGLFGLTPTLDLSKWQVFGTVITLNDLIGSGQNILRVDGSGFGASALLSIKQFDGPTLGATTVTSNRSATVLEGVVRVGTINTLPTEQYFFGFLGSRTVTIMAGPAIGFLWKGGPPGTFNSTSRTVFGVRVDVPLAVPDQVYHWLKIEVFHCLDGSTNPPGPNFWVDGVLADSRAAGSAEIALGPWFVQYAAAQMTSNPRIHSSFCACYYRRREGQS